MKIFHARACSLLCFLTSALCTEQEVRASGPKTGERRAPPQIETPDISIPKVPIPAVTMPNINVPSAPTMPNLGGFASAPFNIMDSLLGFWHRLLKHVLCSPFDSDCGRAPLMRVPKLKSPAVEAVKPAIKVESDTVAICKNGVFSCIGPDKEYCEKQRRLCNCRREIKPCHPVCNWHCGSIPCDESCAPVCAPPVCQTRCKGFNTQSCHMKCGKPSCAVICPRNVCEGGGCPKCTTQCSPPTCHMLCGEELQNCQNVCAEPLCTWNCNRPTACPKPVCTMRCDAADNCLGNGGAKGQLPPLKPGETQVKNFQASGRSLLQETVHINMTTKAEDSSISNREVELPVSPDCRTIWKRMITRFPNGEVHRRSAVCDGGHVQCKGDARWCSEQRANLCRHGGRTGLVTFMGHRPAQHSL